MKSDTEIVGESMVAALAEVWASTDELLDGLRQEEWLADSPCPGWRVRDVVAHIVGAELTLSGRDPAVSADVVMDVSHVSNDIGVLNERWVESLRKMDVSALHSLFRSVVEERLKALREMTPADFAAESWTPAGVSTYGRFMQIRVFDCWVHEQDIRDAVGIPGGEKELGTAVMLDEIERALGYVVGKQAKAPEGSLVAFKVAGSTIRHICVESRERARVVDRFSRAPDVTLSMSTGVFSRLCCGRVRPAEVADAVTLFGDVVLGKRILDSLRFTI